MEAAQLIALWEQATANGEEVFLATVVHVQGSSYRKPGARMLVTSTGRRAGMISGGCLEGEVSRKISWHTRTGPTVLKYRSSFDDANAPGLGLGCDGTVWVLMERGDTVHSVLRAMRSALHTRTSAVVCSSFANNELSSTRLYSIAEIDEGERESLAGGTAEHLKRSLSEARAISPASLANDELPQYVCMPIVPPPRLHVFGAGDDAQPIVRFASELGWIVSVADGRKQLLQQNRFPQADSLTPLHYGGSALQPGTNELCSEIDISQSDCAVLVTHSYEQDRALLKKLLPLELTYLGVLGPLHRTKRIVAEVANEVGLTEDECLARLHAPVGLDLGSHEPAVIALSIVTEIQATLANTRISTEKQGRPERD